MKSPVSGHPTVLINIVSIHALGVIHRSSNYCVKQYIHAVLFHMQDWSCVHVSFSIDFGQRFARVYLIVKGFDTMVYKNIYFVQ